MTGNGGKSTIKDWLKVLVLLLDEIAALVLVLLILWFFRIKIPLVVAIVIALLLGAFTFIINKAVVTSFRQKQASGAEGMIGLEGKVIESLTPYGVIRVKGEYWKAKSVNGNITSGDEVEIRGLSGLTLEVKRKN